MAREDSHALLDLDLAILALVVLADLHLLRLD